MDFRYLDVRSETACDEDDDTVTESTEKIVRKSSGFYFDIVLDIVESHLKQNVEI